MIHEQYTWNDWTHWDRDLHAAIHTFREAHAATPNIVLASSATLDMLDMVAKQQHLRNPSGRHPKHGEYAPIQSFAGPDYRVDFAVDDALCLRQFALVCDPHAEFITPPTSISQPN